jgi:uncharacterized protein YbaR (Trm112 family)
VELPDSTIRMKPWLLNILACPIDKHHPLEAYIFSWETPEKETNDIVADSGKPKKELEEKYTILRKQLSDGTISPPSIEAIKDLTGFNKIITLQTKVTTLLSAKLESKEDLDTLYSYLNILEVREGLLVCPECSRWYPIGRSVESIPELMPDELREPEKELEWLGKWKGVVPSKVLETGKPFKLE